MLYLIFFDNSITILRHQSHFFSVQDIVRRVWICVRSVRIERFCKKVCIWIWLQNYLNLYENVNDPKLKIWQLTILMCWWCFRSGTSFLAADTLSCLWECSLCILASSTMMCSVSLWTYSALTGMSRTTRKQWWQTSS